MNINESMRPTDGFLKNNPIFISMVTVTSAVIVTKTVIGAAIFSALFLCVLILSSTIANLILSRAGRGLYLAVYMVIASCITAAGEICIAKFFPTLAFDEPIYIPLIVISATLVSFTYKNGGYLRSVAGSFFGGVGYCFAIIIISFVRELLSTGMLFSFGDRAGISIFKEWFAPIDVLKTAAGALILVGLIIALVRYIANTREDTVAQRQAEFEQILRGEHETLVYDEELDVVVFRTTIAKREIEKEESERSEMVDLTMLEDDFKFELDDIPEDEDDDEEVSFEDYDYE